MIIDGGGRGSALAAVYAKSKQVTEISAVPGNDFMKYAQSVTTFPKLKTTDTKDIIKIAKNLKIDLVDVAQDDAVAAGLVDLLKKNKIKAFGPTKAAGQIEWDKAWSRNFMEKFDLPSPAYVVCKSQKEGLDFINKQKESKWFVKAAGLAAGKGAIFAKNEEEAKKAIYKMKQFAKAGETFLIEQCLEGEEFSAFAICAKDKFEIVGYAQDHKRVFDGDLGPNTGGMGCSSPPKIVTKNIDKQVKQIVRKTIKGLVSLKRPYVGILYLGAMVDRNDKVWIIEFNARWGDPEAQVILPGIKNNYFELVNELLKNNVHRIKNDNKHRIVVAATSKGYPDSYSKVIGKPILGFDKILKSKVSIFGAAIKKSGQKWTANGGRLFYLMAEGKSIKESSKMAYLALNNMSSPGKNLHYRKDIGWRDLKRK